MTTGDRDILAATRAAETYRVERTTSETDTDKFGEAICAFSNDLPNSKQPGYLVIGIEDGTGRVVGVRDVERLTQTIAGLRSDGNILPPPALVVERVAIDQKEAIVVVVTPSDYPPVRYRGRTFIRVTARRGIATSAEERILSERAIDRTRTWDMRACTDASIDDLALELFKLDYLPKAVAKDVLAENGRSSEEQLSSLRFFDARRNHPTNAGIILFAKDPLFYAPGAYVQYVRYAGDNQASDVLEENRITGGLSQVLKAMDSLANQIARGRPIRQADLTDRTIYDYPPVAIHELLMNAAIHRNYEGSTAPIQISHYSDRLEVLNPGSLHGELAGSKYPVGTSYRNPVLAEAAKVLGFVNRFGRGIATAKSQLAANDSPPLELRAAENHFLVVVRIRP